MIMTFSNYIKKSSSSIANNNTSINLTSPLAIVSITLILLSITIPCLIWFIRNFSRIILKREVEFLTRNLKRFFIGGFFVFLIGLIFLIIAATGVA